jgi:hypothetical protein
MSNARRSPFAGLAAFSALGLLVAAAGCASGDIRAFHGDDEANAVPAVLEISPGLEVVSIDGNREWSGRSTASKPLEVYFPEGNHTISIRLHRDEQEGQMVVHEITTVVSEPVDLDGYFRSGRVYRIGTRDFASSWQPTIRDVTGKD